MDDGLLNFSCVVVVSVSYFVRLRQDWIDETLRIFGFIQRKHLERKFDISPQQATKDFHVMTERRRDVFYCPKGRCYKLTEQPND